MALGDLTLSPCCPAAPCIAHASVLLHQTASLSSSETCLFSVYHLIRKSTFHKLKFSVFPQAGVSGQAEVLDPLCPGDACHLHCHVLLR